MPLIPKQRDPVPRRVAACFPAEKLILVEHTYLGIGAHQRVCHMPELLVDGFPLCLIDFTPASYDEPKARDAGSDVVRQQDLRHEKDDFRTEFFDKIDAGSQLGYVLRV